ncbi:MAG: putative DNA-binding domain-containing protein [Amphritea sp.]|nr:putative DNA-binding domain-containing protein [Amphritea sp.]
MALSSYIDAFADYLRTGDASGMNDFCINAEHIKRMSVYRNGFYKGCIDALAANFPMCEKFVGSESFKNIARIYVDHYPPEKGTLVGYGQNFPDFLSDFIATLETPPETLKLSPRLVDLARLDYAWLMSLMSADSTQTLTAEKISWLVEGGRDFTQAVVKLNPSVALLQVNIGTFNQWIALKTNLSEAESIDNSDVEELHKNNSGLERAEGALPVDTVMFWRVQGAVQARLLSTPEVSLMQVLQGEGAALEKAFDAALALEHDFDVSDVFSACLQNEILEIDMAKYNHDN